MFDLDKQIASWRKRFLNDSAFYGDEVEELENHVRDAVERFVAEGYTEREAFLEATRLLGDPTMLRREYKNSRPVMERLFVPAAVVAVATFLLPILVVSLASIHGWYAIYLAMSATILSPLGHALLTGLHFPAVFVVIGAGALRMGRSGQRRFALAGSGLLMGLMLAFSFVEYTTPSGHAMHMLTMPALVLMLSLFFKGSRLVAATSVLAGLVSIGVVYVVLADGSFPMTLLMTVFDILLGLIVSTALAKRQIAETLRLA